MPKQKTGIEITNLGNGNYHILFNGVGREIEISELFNDDVNQKQIIDNLRLAFLIGGYRQINSEEFLADRRIHTRAGTFYINAIDLVDESTQTYSVQFNKVRGRLGVGIEISLAELSYDEQDYSVIVANIGTHLKRYGYTSLTPAAIESVKTEKFWW